MVFYRVFSNREPECDLLVAQALHDEIQNLQLSGTQIGSREPDREYGRNRTRQVFSASVYCPDRVNQLVMQYVFGKVRPHSYQKRAANILLRARES